MQIDKQQIIAKLTVLGHQDEAGQPYTCLPGQVDTDQHAGLMDSRGSASPTCSAEPPAAPPSSSCRRSAAVTARERPRRDSRNHKSTSTVGARHGG